MTSRVFLLLWAAAVALGCDPNPPPPALVPVFTPPPPPPPPPPTPTWLTDERWTARLDDDVLVVGPISEATVSGIVRGREAWLRECERVATPEGRFVVRVDIDEDGRVQRAHASASSGNGKLDACLLAKLRAIQFPAPTSGSKSIAHLSFTLAEVEVPWRPDGARVIIGPGNWISARPLTTTRIGGGDTVITGSLDPAIIEAVIKRHLAQIQYCYERELPANPKLTGKIVENFTIESDGRVSVARTKSSSMGHKGVEACINDRFMKIRFPQPKGGGIVTVNYPLLFKSGG